MIFPVEIKEHIFNHLDSKTLIDVVTKVCKEWEEIAEEIIDSRISTMLKFLTLNSNLEFNDRIHPSLLEDHKSLLHKYETSFVYKNFEIKTKRHIYKFWFDTFYRNAELVLQNIFRSRGCNCGLVNECLRRAISFMQCHELIIAQNPERMTFFGSSILQNDDMKDDSLYIQYSTVVLDSQVNNVWIDNNRHTAFSVYKDLIVSQETTRALILFRVVKVDHDKRHVILENIRRIYLPFWGSELVMLEDKVCIFFTTGRVGVWRKTADEISVSGNSCASIDVIRRMKSTRMLRLNNLVIIKITTEVCSDDDDASSQYYWSIFDSKLCEEGFSIHYLPNLNDLVDSYFLNKECEKCLEVLDIFGTINSIVFHCKVKSTTISKSRCHSSNSSTSESVLVKRIRRPLVVDDFLDPNGFVSLFYNNSQTSVTKKISFTGSFMVPIYNLTANVDNYVFKILGIQRYSRNSRSQQEPTRLSTISIDIINL